MLTAKRLHKPQQGLGLKEISDLAGSFCWEKGIGKAKIQGAVHGHPLPRADGRSRGVLHIENIPVQSAFYIQNSRGTILVVLFENIA